MRNLYKEKAAKGLFLLTAVFAILAVIAIFVFLFIESFPALSQIGFFEFVFGTEWNPNTEDLFSGDYSGSYGIFNMIIGSIYATVGALIIGGTLGYFTAVFLAKFCPKKLKKPLHALVNLLAGIPSVVYGFFAIQVILPALGVFSVNGSGTGLLSVSIVLGIMIVPTIVALSKTGIEAVPESYYQGARAMGVSHEKAIFGTVVPAAKSSIVASFILGIGRAVGETMAVIMVAGNSVNIPDGLFGSFRTLTANIVLEMGYAGELQLGALISTGVVLLFFVLAINVLFNLVAKKDRSKDRNTKLPLFLKTIHAKMHIADIKAGVQKLVYRVKLGIYYVTDRINTARIGKYTAASLTTITTMFLLGIITFILVKGLPYITWDFLTSDYEYGGAISIFPSIVSTLMLVFLSIVIAVPLGIMTAIYLNEYTKAGNKLVKFIRSAIEILAGIPSIVYGLFGMIFFCGICGLGTSIAAGAFTVSIMILPTIVRSTEESLMSVPDSFREGSLALGAGKLRTIFKVVLPSALPGILSAVILSIGRVVAESAPLMFTMGASLKPLGTDGFLSSGTSLAVALYKLAGEGLYLNEAYATACVLIIIVLALNALSSFVVKALQKKQTGVK